MGLSTRLGRTGASLRRASRPSPSADLYMDRRIASMASAASAAMAAMPKKRGEGEGASAGSGDVLA